VTGFVASTPDFHEQPAVVDGASRVLYAVFGDAGRHTRSAIGVAALPRGGAVEIEVTVAVVPGPRRFVSEEADGWPPPSRRPTTR
jgi:enamine deaminase RidA (YjgF/YER057c/UK114 family)